MSLNSYNLQGMKESYANWISSITPEKTPFISWLGVDPIANTTYSWLADRGSFEENFDAADPAKEGDDSVSSTFTPAALTKSYTNHTQIFRRIVKISNTALSSSVYGRETELAYQLAKASIDLKKEIEYRFLSKQTGREASDTQGGISTGFFGQCMTPEPMTGSDFPTSSANADWQTGAITSISVDALTSVNTDVLDELTRNLVLAGSHAHIMMYKPTKDMATVIKGIDFTKNHLQWTKETDEFGLAKELPTYTNSVGKTYILKPNVWMPENTIYFYSPDDWDLVILQEPKPKQLDTNGSFQTWLVEMEVGLRHANEYASGVITVA